MKEYRRFLVGWIRPLHYINKFERQGWSWVETYQNGEALFCRTL